MGERSHVIPLPGGCTLTVRPATAADVDGLVGLYDSLSVEDRRRRFFTASLPRRDVFERFVETTGRDGLWLVAVTGEDEVVADAGYNLLPDGDAELAITVRKSWRGWLGSHLLDAILTDTREHGIRNLQADILLENRPMIRLAQRRGYATIDQPDWTTVNITMSTEGGRPAWPPAHERPRLLVEGCGARWHGDVEAWAAGWDVITCAGPGGRSVPACPLLDGDRCPLVDGADLVVVAVRSTDPTHAALLDGHHRTHTAPPVLDDSTVAPAELSARLASPGANPQPRNCTE